MSNHSYNVETYNATLQSEVNKLWGIGIVLLIVLIAMIVYSIVLIKEDKTKKFPYIQLIGVVVISAFLTISFSSSIISYSKDISEEAYIQYEGPATISERRKFVLGNIPTWYNVPGRRRGGTRRAAQQRGFAETGGFRAGNIEPQKTPCCGRAGAAAPLPSCAWLFCGIMNMLYRSIIMVSRLRCPQERIMRQRAI